MFGLRHRRRDAEWMDEPGADPAALRRSLAYIRSVNRVMGYTRVILRQLHRFSAGWERGRAIRILDVGTGSADIPLAVLRWAERHGWDVRVVGVDLNPVIAGEALAAARAATIHDSRLAVVQADALRLPFADASFDYAISSMFMHHLDTEDAARAMTEMNRVARRGVIVSDLLRLPHAYAFIWLFTTGATPMVRHDARVSVAQSFTRREVLRLRDSAGLDFAKYSTHLTHRFVLAGEKPSPPLMCRIAKDR